MEPQIGITQIFIKPETRIAIIIFHNDFHGYVFDFAHITNLIAQIIKKIESPTNTISKEIQSKLRVYCHTVNLIGAQLLRYQLENSHKIFDSLFRQSQDLLKCFSKDKKCFICLEIIDDINWAFSFYQTFYDKMMNSLIEFYKGDTDKLKSLDDISNFEKMYETFFLDKEKSMIIRQAMDKNNASG